MMHVLIFMQGENDSDTETNSDANMDTYTDTDNQLLFNSTLCE